MAYKFSIGQYRHSGSLVAEEGLTVDAGGLTVTGDVQLDNGVIDNAELANSEITINGYATALGASVTLDTDDVAEGSSNLYYTDARWDTKMAAASTDDLAEGSNLYYTEARWDTKMAAASTDDLAEGSNLYYTDARVQAAVSAGAGLTYDGAGQFAVTSSIAGDGLAWSDGVLSVDTAEIAAGLSGSVEDIVDAHLSGEDFITYTAGVVGVDASAFTASFDAVLGARDTGDLAEGSNLYFTDARARAAVSATDAGGDGSFAYDSATGVFTYTGPSAAEARAHFSAVQGVKYDAAAGQFALTSSVAGAALSFAAGVLNVERTGAIQVAVDKLGLHNSVAGAGIGHASDINGMVSSLSVNVDASSIEINADALRVKALGITNDMLAGSIANAKLVNSSVTVVAGEALAGGGTVALGGTITLDAQVNGDALEITGDAIALKSSISGDRTFANNVTISGDLTVNGTTTYINTTDLVVSDALIKIASGSAAFAADQGLELGDYATLKTAAGVADVGNALSSSLPLVAPSMKAASFYGNLVGSMQLSIETKSADATISKNVTRASANITLTLPASPVVGQEHRIKCVSGADNVIVAADGGTIDGAASIVLESPSAAVSLVWDGSAWMVF